MIDRKRLLAELTRDEDEKLRVYYDPLGIPTIGIGRNLRDKGITHEESLYLCGHDIDECITDLSESFPWFVLLNGVRQRALVNMRFNLGPTRFRKFVGTIAALEAGNFKAAAEGMRLSKWAKQVGQRAERLAVMMEHGQEPVEPHRAPYPRRENRKVRKA